MTYLRLIALLLCLISPATLFAQEAEGAITTENSAEIDADIATRMRQILEELGGYEDVTVTVSDGVVTLRGTTASTAEATELDGLVSRIEGVVAVKNDVTETAELGRRLSPAFERFRDRIDQMLIFLPLAAIAAAVFALVVFIGFMLARARRPWDQIAPNAFIADLYRQIVRVAFVIFGLVIALDILNATALLSTILGAAGIIGLALGFAVRDTVENFIASILLSIRQPFQPNDSVEINGDEGKVIRLTSRATILLSFDGNHIRIPNSTVFKSRILNYSQNRERRFKFTVRIAPDTDPETARSLSAATVQALPFVLDEPGANAWIDKIVDGGVEIVVVGWIDQTASSLARAKGEAIRQVRVAFEEAKIGIPDTTYQIRMEEPPKPGTSTKRRSTAKSRAKASEIATVTSNDDEALTRMIDAERNQPEAEDLLRSDAMKE